MLFNSPDFLIFFPVVLALFYLVPHRWRWLLLLIASYYFYMGWNAAYASLLLLTTTADYFIANGIAASENHRRRRVLLGVSLALNLGLLGYFKYYNFFIDNLRDLTGTDLAYMRFLLPVGISFYTFQEVGYVIDVYRRQLYPERHFGRFALFVSYFPQLVAGPIERAGHLMHQLREKVELNYVNFSRGAQFMIWGFFKKVVIADNLAPIVDAVYQNPSGTSWPWLVLGTYFFAVQIYCDFSGYSDIAIGVARMMGVNLMENFRVPYLSQGIREFWSRWHISLSTWFRDYLYIPLGGNKTGYFNTQRNLMIVFAVSGLWHGAAWTFVVWGLIHGAWLVIENMLRRSPVFTFLNVSSAGIMGWMRVFVTFHVVVFAWIFFRAENLHDAGSVIEGIFSLREEQAGASPVLPGYTQEAIVFKLLLALSFFFLDNRMYTWVKNGGEGISSRGKMLLYALLVALICLWGNWGEVAFIYFQF